MGFGILFLGYSIVTIFSLLGTYSFIGLLIGYFMMFMAITELRKYCPTFLYAIIASVLMIFCSFYECFEGIDTLFDLGILNGAQTVSSIFEKAEFVIGIIFNLTLLYGIADLARRVDLQSVRTKAFRNMAFVGIYAAYQLIMLLPIGIIRDDQAFFMTLLMILVLVYSLFNLALIFRCYAFICPQGEEEMKRKPSRFEFVNRLRARNDAKEQETIDYYNKKLEDMKNRRNNKKNKKK